MFFDSEIDRIFKKMSNSFFDINDVFEAFKGSSVSGPLFYGCTMTVGPDGKPIVQEYENAKPDRLSVSDTREAIVDTIVDEKEKIVKLIAEMPGVEKTDVKILVDKNVVDISAEHGEKNTILKFRYNRKLMKTLQKLLTKMESYN